MAGLSHAAGHRAGRAGPQSGEVSARELVEESLRAIHDLNDELNAFVTTVAERALAEADAVKPGDDRPLAGVPIAVKDLIAWTEGIRTTNGMEAMGDWVPDTDSATVRKLRAAGAIVVGKTNTPELGILPVTEPDRFGPSRNPWDTSRTPGGSSGGSAAAVASGMVSLAHGNDGGGSIRIPASCCGLVGLKPSRGRVSWAPQWTEGAIGLPTDGVPQPHGARHRRRARPDLRLRARRQLPGAGAVGAVRRGRGARAGPAADRLHPRAPRTARRSTPSASRP